MSGPIGVRSPQGNNVNHSKDATDPKYIGPGTWNVIHRLASKAVTKTKQDEFISTMTEICNGFPCHICRGHCQEYMRNHPIQDYISKTIDIDGSSQNLGLFIWTWEFHNAVNSRLQKPIMDWDTAKRMYIVPEEEGVCSASCLDAVDFNTPGDASLVQPNMSSQANLTQSNLVQQSTPMYQPQATQSNMTSQTTMRSFNQTASPIMRTYPTLKPINYR